MVIVPHMGLGIILGMGFGLAYMHALILHTKPDTNPTQGYLTCIINKTRLFHAVWLDYTHKYLLLFDQFLARNVHTQVRQKHSYS